MVLSTVSLETPPRRRPRRAAAKPEEESTLPLDGLDIHIQTIIRSGAQDTGEPVPISDDPVLTPADLEVAQQEEIQRIREFATIPPDVDPNERLRAIREREKEKEEGGNQDSRCGYD